MRVKRTFAAFLFVIRAGNLRNPASIRCSTRDFTLLQRVQTVFGPQPPSYPFGTEDCFHYDKAAAEWS
jgi:hypothetical protein